MENTTKLVEQAESVLADAGWLVCETPEEGDLVTGHAEGEFMEYDGGWVAHITDVDANLNVMISFEHGETGAVQQAMRAKAENIPAYWEL